MILSLPSHRLDAAAALRLLGPACAGAFLVFLLLALLLPGAITSYQPQAIDPAMAFRPPGIAHPFGTDQCGRDVFTRIVFGARLSLVIGAGSVALGMAIALVIALLGGLGGPVARRIVERVLEVQFSFPTIVFALLFSAHLGGGIGALILMMGLGLSAGYAKTILARIVAVREAPYIEAAHALGHSRARVLARQILPNALRPLGAMLTIGVGHAVAWSSSLSFLGLGVSPPSPEWGTMLAMGRNFITRAWWLTFYPGLFIVLTTLAATVVGRAMQRAIEHRAA